MSRSRRGGLILLGFFLILVGLGSLFEGLLIGLLFVLMGGLLVNQQWQQAIYRELTHDLEQMFTWLERAHPAPPLSTAAVEPAAEMTASRIYKHALAAMRAAGQDPERSSVHTVDLGLLVTHGDQPPVLYRTFAIPDDATFIQPYIRLRLPTAALGRVRFELADIHGEVVFVHEDRHDLAAGETLITPSGRLRVTQQQAHGGRWTLRISADGVPLATHTFTWDESEHKLLRRHMGEDGEMSGEIRAMLARQRLKPLSLDELLAPQEADNPARRLRE